MQQAQKDSWMGYALCAVLCFVNVIGVGYVQAWLYARTGADLSFAGMYVVAAVIVYSIPALAVSAFAALGYSMCYGISRVAAKTLVGVAVLGTAAIWLHALFRIK
jgi:hypothetical protein